MNYLPLIPLPAFLAGWQDINFFLASGFGIVGIVTGFGVFAMNLIDPDREKAVWGFGFIAFGILGLIFGSYLLILICLAAIYAVYRNLGLLFGK